MGTFLQILIHIFHIVVSVEAVIGFCNPQEAGRGSVSAATAWSWTIDAGPATGTAAWLALGPSLPGPFISSQAIFNTCLGTFSFCLVTVDLGLAQ